MVLIFVMHLFKPFFSINFLCEQGAG